MLSMQFDGLHIILNLRLYAMGFSEIILLTSTALLVATCVLQLRFVSNILLMYNECYFFSGP